MEAIEANDPEIPIETSEDAPSDVPKIIPNKKGRAASVASLIFFGILISFIIIKGDYSLYPVLMLVLFILLETLGMLRIVQEYGENGKWLEPE